MWHFLTNHHAYSSFPALTNSQTLILLIAIHNTHRKCTKHKHAPTIKLSGLAIFDLLQKTLNYIWYVSLDTTFNRTEADVSTHSCNMLNTKGLTPKLFGSSPKNAIKWKNINDSQQLRIQLQLKIANFQQHWQKVMKIKGSCIESSQV